MDFLFDMIIVLVSLIFLGIVGVVAGVAIPGLFMAIVTPWLDWILPIKRRGN
jgi:hypothetical protein